jgi:hypothetical protein
VRQELGVRLRAKILGAQFAPRFCGREEGISCASNSLLALLLHSRCVQLSLAQSPAEQSYNESYRADGPIGGLIGGAAGTAVELPATCWVL